MIIDSFITWVGGKKCLRGKILNEFPVDKFDRYIEVFGGAGWVLFSKDKHTSFEVFNDVNSNLTNLYRCVKFHCDEVIKEVDSYVLSRENFFSIKNNIDSNNLTDIQRAAGFYILIKNSFCGTVKSFKTNVSNTLSNIEYLKQIKRRLDKVVIENKDFENLIKVYDRSTALFYLDPPYFKTEKYYANEFTLDDHKRLKSTLDNIKGKFILSYNDDDFIRSLYKDYNIIAVDRFNNISHTVNYGEVIIKNY